MNARSQPNETRPAAAALQQAFAQALQAHQAGRLAEAEPLYRRILAVAPAHDESLHLLGVIACQCGQGDGAVELIGRAIALRGDVAVYHYNLGLAWQLLGRADAAAPCFERAGVLQPDYVDAHNNLAVARMQQGRLDAASAGFERVLALRPDHVEACCNLGVALQHRGRLDEAVARFEQALALRPDYPEAYYNLGLAEEQRGRAAAAIAAYEHALALLPDHPDALLRLAGLLLQQARVDEAASWYDRAVVQHPGLAEAWQGLGSTRHLRGRPDEALSCYQRAIDIRPDYPDPHSNIALILKDRGDIAGAMARLDRALALKPDYPDAALNQAMIRLMTGDYRAGWRQFEARWQTRQLDPDRRTFAVPRWDGAAGTGGTLLVWAEQGLGDSLQFCRYVPLLAARGWKTVVEVPPSLVRLLGGLAGAIVVPPGGAAGFAIDCHCPMLSLPLLFETELDTIPAAVPYLAPAPAAVERWGDLLGKNSPVGRASRPPAGETPAPLAGAVSSWAGRPQPGADPSHDGEALTVGLVWAGNPGQLTTQHAVVDTRRSLALERLAPLLAITGVRFVSLQKDPRAGEAPAAWGLLDPMPAVEDFADTAAIVDQLDLVIAVDTSVVHLAGALGKPVWLLNRFDTCWRWLHGRDDSPWYPTLRQFRQQAPGDWDGVIAAAAAALAGLAAQRRGA